MPRTLIVGSGGRLGASLMREWRRAGDDVIGLNHKQLDLADSDALAKTLNAQQFDVLVNCAALTNVDYCETHSAEAFRINSDAVGEMAEICSSKGARCIHVSTDYVFDGETSVPYTEDDEARPVSEYGASKRAGELALLAVSDQHLVVRVSWVFGPDRPSFVDQIVKRALESDTVEAIGDKWAVPTYTLDAAELLRPFLHEVSAGGIVHLCNGGGCTWQEYGQFALDCAAKAGAPLRAKSVGKLHMADLKAFIAKRPPFTVMSTEKLTRLTGREPRSWQDAVADYIPRMFGPAAAGN